MNISKIKDAKYFIIVLNTTLDIAHKDQFSEIVCLVHISENRKVEI